MSDSSCTILINVPDNITEETRIYVYIVCFLREFLTNSYEKLSESLPKVLIQGCHLRREISPNSEKVGGCNFEKKKLQCDF